PDLWDVQGSRHTTQHRRERPHEELVVVRLVAAKADFELGIADGGHNAAHAARYDEPASDVHEKKDADGDDVEREARGRVVQRVSEDALVVGEAVVAAESGRI